MLMRIVDYDKDTARRVGNVLLTAWISQSETATLSAAPAPAPLPEAVVEQQQPQPAGEQATTNAKGFQQVTAWQVRCGSSGLPHTQQSAPVSACIPVWQIPATSWCRAAGYPRRKLPESTGCMHPYQKCLTLQCMLKSPRGC